MSRKVMSLVWLITAGFFLASAVSADGPPKKRPPEKGKAKPAPKPMPPPPNPGKLATEVIIVGGPDPNILVMPVQLQRGEKLSVFANVRLPKGGVIRFPAGQEIAIHVEAAPGKWVKVASGKTNTSGAGALIAWTVGAKFPAGEHRWTVRFPGTTAHQASQTKFGKLVLP